MSIHALIMAQLFLSTSFTCVTMLLGMMHTAFPQVIAVPQLIVSLKMIAPL